MKNQEPQFYFHRTGTHAAVVIARTKQGALAGLETLQGKLGRTLDHSGPGYHRSAAYWQISAVIRPEESLEDEPEPEPELPDLEICAQCGDSVAWGSGKRVNRVAEANSMAVRRDELHLPFPQGGWICYDCEREVLLGFPGAADEEEEEG